ncbi:uncharacterized protein [Rutidosis leptorrhynchoides]|uniref:uncharacterized protein n=1 Tax=Rutidosis leptorrhynchoides TaxID=125765 RepID=UPI003A98EB86
MVTLGHVLRAQGRVGLYDLEAEIVDILCVQETRWKGRGAVKIKDYTLWFSRLRVARNGVGIIIGPLYNVNVMDVSRRSDMIMSVRLVILEVTYTVISAYAPHVGLGGAEKRHFRKSLDEVMRMCPPNHRLLIGGDLNVHIGSDVEGYPGAHGGFGYGVRNEEGLSILDFSIAHDLVVTKSFFRKTNARLATFHSGGHSTQIDYLLLHKGDLRTCRDCKVLTDLTCSSQHRLLVMDLVLRRRVTKSVRPDQPKILWKKLNGEKAETFKTLVVERVDAEVEMVSHDDEDQMWNCLALVISAKKDKYYDQSNPTDDPLTPVSSELSLIYETKKKDKLDGTTTTKMGTDYSCSSDVQLWDGVKGAGGFDVLIDGS